MLTHRQTILTEEYRAIIVSRDLVNKLLFPREEIRVTELTRDGYTMDVAIDYPSERAFFALCVFYGSEIERMRSGDTYWRERVAFLEAELDNKKGGTK